METLEQKKRRLYGKNFLMDQYLKLAHELIKGKYIFLPIVETDEILKQIQIKKVIFKSTEEKKCQDIHMDNIRIYNVYRHYK